MPADAKAAFEDFAYVSFAEFRATLKGAPLSERMWKETMAKIHDAWHASRKPKRKKPIADEGAWVESLKHDPYLEGVDIDKERAAALFWCRNQQPPLVLTRHRFTNWLKKADRVVTGKAKPAVDPLPEPPWFEKWFLETRSGGETAFRPWKQWSDKDKVFFIAEMAKEKK